MENQSNNETQKTKSAPPSGLSNPQSEHCETDTDRQNRQSNPKPQDEPKPKFQVSIFKKQDGTNEIVATGEGFTMAQCREMVQWALNEVNDKLNANMIEAYINAVAQKKLKQNGFRPTNLLKIFR